MREDRTAFEPESSPGGEALAPPPDLVVGAASAEHVSGCVALAGLVADGARKEWSALFQRDLGRDDRYLVVARIGDEVIGYGRTAWFEPDADAPSNVVPAGYYLIGLVVAPSWRRRGVADAITRDRLTWVAERASEAWYMADRSNVVSVRLHERVGFETFTDDFWFPTAGDSDGEHVLGRLSLPRG